MIFKKRQNKKFNNLKEIVGDSKYSNSNNNNNK